MQRRGLFKWLFSTAFGTGFLQGSQAMTREENNLKAQEYRKKALALFPLKLIETSGDKALATWQELKTAGQGSPVVLGGDDKRGSFDNLLTPFDPIGANLPTPPSIEEILKAAADIRFPDDLAKHKKAMSERLLSQFKANLAANPNMPLPTITETKNGINRTYTRDEVIASMEREPHNPPVGVWPASPETSAGLSVVQDIPTGKSFPKVYIGVAPTDDWTTIPAYLRWGDWNDCPAAEYHVAAMRIWRDRYGAELVGINSDTINLRVKIRPKTREEALALARDQYIYCPDLINQGVQTYNALAAALMANDWWYFWWD